MDIENLAAENARLKSILAKAGYKISYNQKTGAIARVSKPRKPAARHTAVTWSKKRGFKLPNSIVRRITKNKAVSYRKYKNALERAELIKNGQEFLKQNGYNVPSKFFDKIPTYALKDNAFYATAGQFLHYQTDNEDGEGEIDEKEIAKVLKASVTRVRKLNATVKSQVADQKKKAALKRKAAITINNQKIELKKPSTAKVIRAVVKPKLPPIIP